MRDITDNVKRVMIIYLLVFIALISYITYFILFTGPKIVDRPDNQRLWAQRNEVLRGTIYDRNMTVLSASIRNKNGTQSRTYNGGVYTAHILGYMDAKYGITGLENRYDSYLMKNTTSDWIKALLTGAKKEDKVGENLVTTLDFNLQKTAYNALAGRVGAAVVLNAKTGEILAMVSTPSYNPNTLDEDWKSITTNSDRPLLNRAVSGLYPPGSTFKVLTTISALENITGVSKETFTDKGYYKIGSDYTLYNDNKEVLGNITLEGALKYSSNAVYGSLGVRLGNKALKKTAEDFYFNKNTPADGIIIDNSRFPSYGNSEKGNMAQSAIGQAGVLASPIQMALVAQTVANNGVMMEPHLVSKIVDKNGAVVEKVQPKSLGQKIPADISSIVRQYMKAVVDSGTGRAAKIYGLQVAGKTGTAQNERGKQPHSWFIGFAPYDDPQIAVAVIAEDSGYGSQVAVPAATKIIRAYFNK